MHSDPMVNFLPTIVWVATIVVPALGFLGIYGDYLFIFEYQAIVCIVAVCLFSADYIGYKVFFGVSREVSRISSPSFSSIAFFCLVISCLYAALLPEWPLVRFLFSDLVVSELALVREKASKLSGFPSWFAYLGQSFFLLAVVFFAGIWESKKRFAVFGLLWLVLLGFWDGSKFKGILVCLLLLTGWVSSVMQVNFNRVLGFLLPLILSIGLLYTFHLKSLSFDSPLRDEVTINAKGEKFPYSFGDILRVDRNKVNQNPSSIAGRVNDVFDYLAYRVFVIPSDVSLRWFEYRHYQYPIEYGLERRLANKIGVWAFWERFPQYFLPSVSAYASFDTDATVRFGFWGLAVALICICSCRILFSILCARLSAADMYAVVLCIWALMLPAASIQALIIAQGFGLLLACLFFLNSFGVRYR